MGEKDVFQPAQSAEPKQKAVQAIKNRQATTKEKKKKSRRRLCLRRLRSAGEKKGTRYHAGEMPLAINAGTLRRLKEQKKEFKE